jgi:hypothetical protein
MRELLRAVVTGKPIVVLLELETDKGGLTRAEIRHALYGCDAPCTSRSGVEYENKFAMWGLDAEVRNQCTHSLCISAHSSQ